MSRSISLRSFHAGRRAGVLQVADDETAFLAGAAGLGPPVDPARSLSRLLADGAAALGRDLDPAALAAALDTSIRAAGERGPGPISYAAARAGAAEVVICTAGDLRVHLVVDGRVERTTRDHILPSDPIPGMPPDTAARLQSFRTRGVGGPVPSVHETVVWPVAPPYRLVVCSDEYHRFQPVDVYWSALAGDLAAGRDPAPVDINYSTGLVLELGFR